MVSEHFFLRREDKWTTSSLSLALSLSHLVPASEGIWQSERERAAAEREGDSGFSQ